jgi:hypothetical protein
MTRIVRGQTCYRPMEIAELGLIQNSRGSAGTVKGHYDFVLELIKKQKLKAIDISDTDRHYYIVPEKEIVRYHERTGTAV